MTTMNKDIPDIMQVAATVERILYSMASKGCIEAAAVKVKNLAWVVDMRGRESWLLTLEDVEPSTVDTLVPALLHEVELVGLGWDDWDVYTEFPDDSVPCNPQP